MCLEQPVSQGSWLSVSEQPAKGSILVVRKQPVMLANTVVQDKATCMRMDGAASLTPGTSWLLKGVPVPCCILLVLHLVQLGLRGLRSPANIFSTGIVPGCTVQAVLMLQL